MAEKREGMTEDALRLGRAHNLRIGTVVERIEQLVDRRAGETYTPIGLYNRGRGIFHKTPTPGAELGDSVFFWVAKGDLVLSGQFAWEGAVALASLRDNGCVASHRYPVFRGRANMVETAFLWAFFRTRWGQLLLDHHSRGAAGRNRPLNATTLMKEKMPIPPLAVQKQIVSLINTESHLREEVSTTLKLLGEFQSRLIADVVTGNLDVREAAPQIPDDAQGLEPLEDTEALPDEEGEPTDELDTIPEETEG